MRLSLSLRVALGLAAQMIVFAGAVTYLVSQVDALFDELSVLKDDLEPAVEDLKNLVTELKTAEDALASTRPSDVERVRDHLPRTRVFERLTADGAVLRRASERDGLGTEARDALSAAAGVLEEVATGDRLVAGARKTGAFLDASQLPPTNAELFRIVATRLDQALSAGREVEADVMARELLRLVRFLRSSAVGATSRAVNGLRELNHTLSEHRADLSIAMVAVPAGALVAALLLTLLSLRALRPVRELAAAVRRLARGDYSPARSARFSREFADLAGELDSLAASLRAREAEGARSREEQVRTERLAVVGRMASVVAHEVRNPLNSIALNVDLLREMRADLSPRETEVLNAVQREVDRLSEITEDYLRFGRLPKAVLAPCDAGRIVRETRDFMDGELAAAGIEVEVAVPDAPIRVVSDEAQLRQALVNVLRNAIDAMPDGGRLSVRVETAGDGATVSVTDTGCGIPEAFRARLFEPFATTKPRGTGLGLAFVQQVMHESGGGVAIDSTPGKGTTVRLSLRRAG